MSKYFPFLRAKTFELKAVERTSSALVANGKITPLFEPVRVATGTIIKRSARFASAGLSVGLVMNPHVGELSGAPQATTQLLAEMRRVGASVTPVLIVHPGLQPGEVTAFGAHVQQAQPIYLHYGVPAIGAISALNTAGPALNLFVDNATSTNHQTPFPNRAVLRDGFNSQVRNANYPPGSFFSDLHLTYMTRSYVGFGDNKTIGSRYTDGGGPAYAVAIHLTEDRLAQGVYCHHFLSTSNTTPANPAGKFGEAVASLAQYSTANPGKLDFTNACQELLQHHANGTFPGLGEVKRLSIHITWSS
ncbi:sce7725 family protein [Labilithrix luteola]|uniref:sce7725 family protein n=1 Tax=Labilithrix luteola TaxID=1391654 RepID=UPI000AC3F201|nr:sce7725 family protein [Labilithrix luteola]